MNQLHAWLWGAVCGTLLLQAPAHAAVSASEAAKLKTTLTPSGGERAASADGLIPAWTGGLTTPLSKPDGLHNADPFAAERPLFQVNASNVGQYADKLSEGEVYLLRHYPGFAIDVYPAHRTFAMPQRIYDGTFKNATTVHLTPDGFTPIGGQGGIAFPIPTNGAEAITNVKFAFRGVDRQINQVPTYYITQGGTKTLVSTANEEQTYPWYYPPDRPDPSDGKLFEMTVIKTFAPASQAGNASIFWQPIDTVSNSDPAWEYLTGERRVRKYPSVRYDTPFPYTSGLTNFDDTEGFVGPIDRYDWKLVGKKELIVPYNDNGFAFTPESAVGPRYPDPKAVRFEVHRVWVVDATLRAGARHVVPHRRYFIDEDSWTVSAEDQWDASGNLWKTELGLIFEFPEVPVSELVSNMFWDFQKGAYVAFLPLNAPGSNVTFKVLPNEHFQRDSLVAEEAD